MRPARAASAPFCDDRGATALAAPPALQAPDDAIRRTQVAACDGDEPLYDATIAPAHRGPSRAATAVDPGVTAASLRMAPAAPRSTGTISSSRSVPPDGVGLRVERPPRR